MARVDPLPREELGHLADRLALTEGLMGFVPNSMPTMARVPGLAEAFADLGGAIFTESSLPLPLKQMVANVASAASGCRYCQAHTAATANRIGVPEEKLAELWNWSTSDLFDEAERAALDLAFAAATSPNTVTDEHFEVLRQHYDDQQISALVATIALFGFLNRWNDTMATDLEDEPNSFAQRVLTDVGWEPGHHRRDD